MIPFMPLSVSVEGLSLVFYICICLSEYVHQETNVTRHMHHSFNQSGASSYCSKLTTSLVNVSLKFKTLIYTNTLLFFVGKCENLLQ